MRRAAAGIAVSVPHRIGAGGRLRGRAVAGLCVPACGAAHGHPGKGCGRRAAHWGLGGLCTGGGGCVRSRAHRSAHFPAGLGAAARLCVQRAVLCHPHGRAADAGQPRGGGAAVCGPAAGGIPHGGAAVPDAGRGRAGSTRAGGDPSAARTGRADRAGGSRGRRCPPCCWKCVPAAIRPPAPGCGPARCAVRRSVCRGCRCFCRCAPSARPRSRCGLCWQRGRCICRFRWRCSGWAAPCRCRPCRPLPP